MKFISGIKKSPYDDRDFLVRSFIDVPKLVTHFDRTDEMSPVRNQESEGACGGFAFAVAVKEWQETTGKDAQPNIQFSPRFAYEEAKKISGHKEGTTLKALMEVGFKFGVCLESEWPYKPNIIGIPEKTTYETALKYRIKTYARVTSIDDLKQAIIDSKIGPVLIGVNVFKGMVSEEAKITGIVPNPSFFDSSLGGHAVCACAFEDNSPYYKNDGHIKFKNSWGQDWGDHGFGYLSYRYIHKNLLDAFSCVDIEFDIAKYMAEEVGDLGFMQKRRLWI